MSEANDKRERKQDNRNQEEIPPCKQWLYLDGQKMPAPIVHEILNKKRH